MRTMALLIVGALILLGGCAKPIYDWGGYEASVQNMYGADREKAIGEDRARLCEEIEKTVAAQRKVPPGKFAHVGYLCYLSGDKPAAAKFFEAEKQAFPESAPMMDKMLRRLQ